MNTHAHETFQAALSRYRSGDRDGAAGLCRRVLASDEGHGDAARLLALILAESGHAAEGIRLLKGLASHSNAGARVLYTLGRMLAQTGAYAEALAPLKRARAADPQDPAIVQALGYCLVRSGRADEAARAYETALEHRPEDPAILRPYGEILARLARLDDAIDAYRRAMALDPADASGYARLAVLYERTNRLDDMASVVHAGLQRWPDNPTLRFHHAVYLRRCHKLEPALAILRKLQRDEPEPDLGRCVAFEAARILDLLGRYDEAFGQAGLANRLAARLARQEAGDAEPYGDWLDRVHQALDTAWNVASPVQQNRPGPEDVVFIIGFPRSGTTLIEVLLAGCDRYQVYEEKPFLEELFDELQDRGLAYPECGDRLDPDTVEALRRRYFRTAERFAKRRSGSVIVDKNPLATPAVPLLHQVFPRAKYIFAARHPLDVCLSCYFYNFSPNSSLAECETIEEIANVYAKNMEIWCLIRRYLALDVIELPYETLVSDFVSESQRLFDFLGLPWDQSVLDFARHARAGTPTLRNYDRVIQGIYQTSRYRWRHYERHLAGAASIVDEAGAYFGYTPGSAQ